MAREVFWGRSVTPVERYIAIVPTCTRGRITGDLRGGAVPLVIVHGGPGCTDDG